VVDPAIEEMRTLLRDVEKPCPNRLAVIDALTRERVIAGYIAVASGLLVNIGALRFQGINGGLFELTPCILYFADGVYGSQCSMLQEDGQRHPHPHVRAGGAVCWGHEGGERERNSTMLNVLWDHDPASFIAWIKGFLVNQTRGGYTQLEAVSRCIKAPPTTQDIPVFHDDEERNDDDDDDDDRL
jgi:hypothetical protein